MDRERIILNWFAGIGLVVAMSLVILSFASIGLSLSLITLLTGELSGVMALVSLIFAFSVGTIIFGILGVITRNILYSGSDVALEIESIPRLLIHGILLVVLMMILATVLTVFGLALSFMVSGEVAFGSSTLLLVVAYVIFGIVYGWANFEITEILY